MKKKFLFISLIVLIFSISAFAGEGSDTIGACKLMPDLRYSYYEIPMVADNMNGIDDAGLPYNIDWRAMKHSAVVNLTWGALDNLDLYTFVGARICSTIEGTADDAFVADPNTADVRAVFDLGTGFTCGLGVKSTFWRSPGGFYVGGGASVTYAVTNGKKHFRAYHDGTLVFDSLDAGFYYQEQNLAAVADLHAGWNFKNIGLTPYLGVEYRWNKAYVKEREIGSDYDYDITFREQKPVGVYVGLDYLIGNKLSLNLEGHMINRWGGSFSVGYLFDICGKPEPAPAPAPAPMIEPKLEPMSKN